MVALRADLGDRVEQGQILLELDATKYRLAVERQQAALAEVLARLGMAKEDEPLPEPAQTSVVRRATAELAEAKSNFERAKSLQTEGVVSRQLYDSAEARFRVAEANQTAACEEVRNLLARVESLRAQLAIARENLSDTRIRAPFSGTARERLHSRRVLLVRRPGAGGVAGAGARRRAPGASAEPLEFPRLDMLD